MSNVLAEMAVLFSYPKNLIFLAARVVLAYGFSMPALLKINNLEGTVTWFVQMDIPFPTLAAYLVSSIEVIGLVLLVSGFLTRYISVLLSFIMLGAILFVHTPNGFSVANNGVEIPLYYLLFLVILSAYGAGKYSIDNLVFKDGNYE